jgi:methylated-DNA-protein-cysteine methyltransferase related protein
MTDARTEHIVAVIRALQPGEVVSYGDVADVAGYPRQSRFVGRILATTTEDLPWWRVVNSVGRLVPGNERRQASLLRAEGVRIRNGRVVSSPAGRWRP